jgi:hypothetical protein
LSPPPDWICAVASDDLAKKISNVRICDAFIENVQKNLVIDAVEKLSHIALQGKAWPLIAATLGTKHRGHRLDAFVRPFADTTRERCRNKRRLEDRIQDPEYSVVQDSVADDCLMYPAQFGIAYPKSEVSPVPIGVVAQLAVQLENLLFHLLLELRDIVFVALVAFEYIPRREKILHGRHALEYVFVTLHI